MSKDGFHFVPAHMVEQAGADGDKGVVLARTGGKGVGFGRMVDGYFGRF